MDPKWKASDPGREDEIESMVDSTITIEDTEGEIFKIKRIR